MSTEDIATLRNDYTERGIRQSDLPDNPMSLFSQWFTEALESKQAEANGMVLSTVSASGQPSQRTVLMKYFSQEGFYFYTNYASRKAGELAENPRVSCLFPWLAMHRQVAFQGRVEKAEIENSSAYFSTRPRGSQVGAWASRQSQVLPDRETLESQVAEIESRFADQDVPLPDFWGGYHFIPEQVEFWQGRTSRLHDRFVYSRDADDAPWTLRRLYP